jgi:hypothetical protein
MLLGRDQPGGEPEEQDEEGERRGRELGSVSRGQRSQQDGADPDDAADLEHRPGSRDDVHALDVGVGVVGVDRLHPPLGLDPLAL